MREYCTLFDGNYFAKGLALYESLKRHSSEPFTLHILAMDDETFWTLADMHLQYVRLLPVNSFAKMLRLEAVRDNRTHQEWCWTAASQLLNFVLPMTKMLTYLDADTYFFSDPKVIFDEIGKADIAMTPHRLIPTKRHLEVNGKYNVGWVTMRNSETGLKCSDRWAEQTRDWCFNRLDSGRACGDQKYLDEWPELYGDAVRVIENIGVNVAPWNLANWGVTYSRFYKAPCVDGVPVVFYHYHELGYREDGTLRMTNYELRNEDVWHIYTPYISALKRAEERIAEATELRACRLDVLRLQGERA